MKKNISNIISESLFDEVKKTIIRESKSPKEVYQITCEGEPVETFESEDTAMQHLDIYKKKHPKKEFIIEKVKYDSPTEMIDKLDQMGEELEKNKETKKMKKVKVLNMAEAAMLAKDKGLEEFKFNGKKYNVDETWKQLEEMEGQCEGCGQGYMEEETDVEESNAFILAADKAKDDGEKEFEFPKGSGKMHKVTLTKDIETNEGKMGSCKECGSPMNEEGMCSEMCGSGMYESRKKTLKLTESEMVSLIKKMVINTKKNLSEAIPGLEVTKKAQSGSKKDGEDALKDVEKKLKKASTFDGNDNPEFPKQIGKGEKMAINPTKKQDEEIADNRGGTMLDLNYEYEPSENFKKRLKMALEGDVTMGNSQEAANVVKTKTGENLSKSAERKQEKEKEKPEAFYGARGVQPLKVKTVNESKNTMTSILNEEISRMKKIIGYDDSTQ